MSTFVDEAIKSHKVTVFSKSWCPYCVKAKKVLSKYNPEDVHIVELDDRNDADNIQDYLAKMTGARSVPRVFIGGKFIGGGDETAALDKKNQLRPMLEQVGALPKD